MTQTHPRPDLFEDLEKWFRRRVPGGEAAIWERLWASWREQAREAWIYAKQNPEEWHPDADRIIKALRAGMAVGRTIDDQDVEPRSTPGVRDWSERLSDHSTARMAVLAEHASGDARVSAFRDEYLPGGLCGTTDELERWFADHAAEPHVSVDWLTLEGDEATATVNVAAGSAVDGLAARLALHYRWDQRLAVTFLLAGGVPAAPMLTRTTHKSSGPYGNAADLVTLKVHPDTPVGEVADAYRSAQLEVYGGRRPRLESGRVAQAVWASVTVPGGPAVQNESLPEPYRSPEVFEATVRRARRKLVPGLGRPMTVDEWKAREANLGLARKTAKERWRRFGKAAS